MRYSNPMNNRHFLLVARCVLGLVLVLVYLVTMAASQDAKPHWVATWGTSVVSSEHPATFSNQTIRNIVHVALGGSEVRIRLSNTFGPRAVKMDAVYVGFQKEGAALVAGSNRAVTFGGSRTITIPEGAEVMSDPVALPVEAEQNLAISLFMSSETGPATVHSSALQTNYVSDAGNFVASESASNFSKTVESWYFLSAVDVLAPAQVKGVVVALGDSITDGASSRPDKNERWTDVLARRLRENKIPVTVVNAGIGGNRVLTSSPCWGVNALARLGRDVLAQTGIEAVILFEGTNDIGQPDTPAGNMGACLSRTPVSAEDIIAGYKQIIARTHARGLKIYGSTILPYQGYAAWNPQGEAKRIAVNQWIRTSGAFDGVADFDAALRDPANPARIAAQFDGGDHLHPGTAGHEAMGKACELGWFR